MKYSKWIVASAFTGSMLAATAYGQEKNPQSHQHHMLKMEDLPAPVKSTLEREAKGMQVESIKKDVDDGRVKYEVDLMSNGERHELEISESGKVLERKSSYDENNDFDEG
jgi:uncharacterized membrane protein YkoI